MSVEEVMDKYGFRLSASCAGKASYTKWIKYAGKRAYITVMDASGEQLPDTMEEPVQVGIFGTRSGVELVPSQEFSSLQSYLESLDEPGEVASIAETASITVE
ncbi:MAG: hypothetical protein ACYC6G_12170 [Desulfobaccales bacterium]